MSRGNILKTVLHCPVKKTTKLNIFVAHHIGIWCTPFSILSNQILDDVFFILMRKVDGVERDMKRSSNSHRVATFFPPRTGKPWYRPCLYKRTFDFIPLLLQKCCGNRTIYPSGEGH